MKYIDADHLKVEIESLEENARKIRVAKESTTNEKIGADGQVNLCQRLYLLIDSLQQEQPVEGLEEEIENYYGRMPDDTDKIESARHFAEWMKAKMLKEAVEGTVCKDESDVWIELRPDALPNFKDMQPVKLIVKEDVE